MVNLLSVDQASGPRPVTPLGIATAHLQTALQLIAAETEVSAEILNHLRQAHQLMAGLDAYVEQCTTPASSQVQAIAAATQQEPWGDRFFKGATTRQLEQEMLSGHVEGQFLKFLVRLTQTQRVLDIGLFTGYSALAMAEALPEQGQLIACEVDPYVAQFAEQLLQQSVHGQKIKVIQGSALTTLNQLADAEESFDLVFIDADKREYSQYYQLLLDRHLLKPNGIICVDNTLLQGQPYLSSEQQTENGAAIVNFNQQVAADPRVEQILLPIRDGVTLIQLLPLT
jgi:caffeoyl-CoA O-methyltransferase